MASNNSVVTSSSLSSLSVASSAAGAVGEAKCREEAERQEIIKKNELYPTATIQRRTHPVWKKRIYFASRLADHKKDVYCIECRKWIADGTFSHVNQHDHNHHGGCGDGDGDGGSSGSSSSKTQQLKMNQTFVYAPHLQARLVAKLVGFLIRDSRPASLTLGQGFREFVRELNPRFTMPGLKKIRAFTRAMYEEARDVVLTYIQPLKQKGPAALRGMAACVSLDLWTDCTQVEYMGVLLHTIKQTPAGYEQKVTCLACIKVDETHITAEVVQGYVEATLKKYGLPIKSIFRAVHDGDAKVIKGVRAAGLRSSLCFIHSLHRTIAVSLKNVDAALASLKRTKKVVTGVRQSNVQAAYLREAQESIGAPQRALIQENQTRWGSTHDMAERVTEQRGAFPAAYALDDDRNPAASKKVFEPEKRLQPGDFPLLGQIVSTYNPFRTTTRDLQSDGITASLVVPAFMTLQEGLQDSNEAKVRMPAAGNNYPATFNKVRVDQLHPAVKQIASQARSDMISRFKLQRMLPLAVASCLDQRIKSLSAFNVPADIIEKAWRVIQLQLDRTITALKKEYRYGDDGGRGEKRDADGDAKEGGGLFDAINAKAQESEDAPNVALPPPGPGLEYALDFGGADLDNVVDVATEITKYLRAPKGKLGAGHPDALQLWWGLREECPALAIVAMHYLCIPASSAAVERLFSGTGLIKTKLRNRLTPEMLEMLIFTRLNWHDSLYNARPPKKQQAGVEESKGGEEEEEEEEEVGREELMAELEDGVAGDVDMEIRAEDDLGLDGLMGLNFVEPDDEFWDDIGNGDELWLDEE